jgi:DNA-binding NarL/FixJ family response regulator
MNKEELKIVIVDDSKVSYVAIKTMLKSIGFENIKYFEYPLDFIQYLKTVKQDDIDIAFIDYQMPEMNGLKVLHYLKMKFKDIVAVMMTSSTDTEVKQKAIKYGVNEFMHKGIDFFEFKAKLNILANLRLYYYESKHHQEELELVLQYKDTQETLAVQKQLKIIEDKVSNHFYKEWIADSYFKPKDILSGDSYSTLKIDDDRFFISIVDGMGKGVSASLSSVLTVSFMNYSIAKSLEFNDFNFERVVRDTFHYAASIMLDNEALSLCMIEVDLKHSKIRYTNLGMPPFYILNKNEIIKIRPNNRPLLQTSKEYIIDEYKGEFDAFLVSSDGLFESVDHDGYPYFIKFKQKYNQFFLLSDLIKDFKANVDEADDDTTIVYLKKDNKKYDTIFNQKIVLTQENIENIVNNIEFDLNDILPLKVVNKIVFALNELLINSYEHSVLKISKNKHKIIQKDKKIEYNGKDKFAFLSIEHNENFAVVFLEDEGEGFDVSDILKSEWFNKYHGRGVKMLKKLSDGIYYNQKGNGVKLYFKK